MQEHQILNRADFIHRAVSYDYNMNIESKDPLNN